MSLTRLVRSSLALVSLFAGCNVEPTAPPTTRGVQEGGGEKDSVDAGGGGASCPSGLVVLLTDYTSTQIALTALDGTPLSPAFLSTASAQASGVAFPLSGDVVLPSTTPASGRVVLVDQYGTNVVTWAEPTTAHVDAQLPIGTGFESNPYDYVEMSPTQAYVSRWDVNADPGKQPFDSGSDLLVINTQMPSIVGSVPMPVEDGLPPCPAGMLPVGDTIIVVLQRVSQPDFATVGVNELVGVQNGTVAWKVPIASMKGCDRPRLSPSGTKMAIGCGGQLDANGNVEDLAAAGIVVFDITSLPPKVIKQYAISDQLGGSGPQAGVAWVGETELLAKTQTALNGSANNQAFSLDLTTGKATVLLRAGTNANGTGKGLVYGDVWCTPGCTNVCLLADADVGKLRRWTITPRGLQQLSDIDVDPTTGLPPVSIGGY